MKNFEKNDKFLPTPYKPYLFVSKSSENLNFLTPKSINSQKPPYFCSKNLNPSKIDENIRKKEEKKENSQINKKIEISPLSKPNFSISLFPLDTPQSLKTRTFQRKLNIVINSSGDYYGAEKPSPQTRTLIYHENKKKTLIDLIPESNKEIKEKVKISSIYKSCMGPARKFDSIKYKLLLASNFEKMTSNYFYKENQEMKDFIKNMKLEGYCPKEIFYHQIQEKQMEIDKNKARQFLINFSDSYEKFSQHFWLNKTQNDYNHMLSNVKLLNSLDFDAKKNEYFDHFNEKRNITQPMSPRKRESYNNRITPKDREKFKNLVNVALSLNNPRNNDNVVEDIEDDFEEFYIEEKNANESIYFSPLTTRPSLKSANVKKKQKISCEELKIDDMCYDMALKKYENDEKLRNLKYFDPLYDEKTRKSATKQKLLICLTKLAKLKLRLQDMTKVSAKPFERKGSIVFFYAVKERNLIKIEELLKYNQLYVFDIDNIHQTALHLACKKGYLDIVKLLLRNGAEVNAFDLFYRTPLYFAIKYGEIDIVRYLLYFQAYPFSSNKCNFEKEMLKDPFMKYYCKEARKLYVILVFVKDLEKKKSLWFEKRRVFCRKAEIKLRDKDSPRNRKKTVLFRKKHGL